MVNVLFPSLISSVTGQKRIDIRANTGKELIEKLVEHYGDNFTKALFEESGEMNRYIRIYVDGKFIENIMENDIVLNDSSNVAILVIISGG